MSRIGKQPVVLSSVVKASIQGQHVHVEGPKGKLQLDVHPAIAVQVKDNAIHVTRSSDMRQDRALHGLTRALLANMTHGVEHGYQQKLEVKGTGYRAAVQGNVIQLNLGKSHPILYPIPTGITITVQDNVNITISGIDKRLVGQVASDLERQRKQDPYKGKGVRKVGKYYLAKEGKTAQSKK